MIRPKAVAMSASAMPPVIAPGELRSPPMTANDPIMPVTVPSSPSSGASVITNARMMLASVRPAGSTVVTLARLVPRLGPDLDGDGTVGGSDLGILLGAWGTPLGDLTGDGTTGGADLGVLLGAWTAD